MSTLELDNTSGEGAASLVPVEATRWNWGAFLLTWIWGIGNHVFLALLMFVPGVNLIVWIVLGAKGGEWAWRNKRWASLEEYQAAQRAWAKWGVVIWSLMLAAMCVMGAILFGIFAVMKNSEAYQLSAALLQKEPAVLERFGEPLSTGYPTGSVKTDMAGGAASLSYSVSGPKGEGRVNVEATREGEQWRIVTMSVHQGGDKLQMVP